MTKQTIPLPTDVKRLLKKIHANPTLVISAAQYGIPDVPIESDLFDKLCTRLSMKSVWEKMASDSKVASTDGDGQSFLAMVHYARSRPYIETITRKQREHDSRELERLLNELRCLLENYELSPKAYKLSFFLPLHFAGGQDDTEWRVTYERIQKRTRGRDELTARRIAQNDPAFVEIPILDELFSAILRVFRLRVVQEARLKKRGAKADQVYFYHKLVGYFRQRCGAPLFDCVAATAALVFEDDEIDGEVVRAATKGRNRKG